MSFPSKGSVKVRFIQIFGTLALVLCLVYSGIAVLFSYVVEDGVIYRLMMAERDHLIAQLDKGQSKVQPRLDNFQLFWQYHELPKSIRLAIEAGDGSPEMAVDAQTYYHVEQLDLGRHGKPYLVSEVSRYLVVSHLSWVMLVFLILVLLGTIAASFWLAYVVASRLTRPIEALTEQARWLEQGDKAIQPNVLAREDEIGYLAQTLNSSFDSLHQTLKRESDFTRDVSHELRTPITILNNLMLTDPSFKTNTAAVQALNDLDNTMEILLALARAENLSHQTCAVAPVIEQTLLQIMEIEGRELAVEVNVPYECQVMGDLNLLTILVKNLINNALHHGHALAIEYHPDSRELVFANQIRDQLPADPTRRGSKSAASEGFGHGLYLVERIIEALNWQYHIVSLEGRFAFHLLPVASGFIRDPG